MRHIVLTVVFSPKRHPLDHNLWRKKLSTEHQFKNLSTWTANEDKYNTCHAYAKREVWTRYDRTFNLPTNIKKTNPELRRICLRNRKKPSTSHQRDLRDQQHDRTCTKETCVKSSSPSQVLTCWNLSLGTSVRHWSLSRLSDDDLLWVSILVNNKTSSTWRHQPYKHVTLSIQVCPRKGFPLQSYFWGWDVSTINPTNFREGSGFLGDHKKNCLQQFHQPDVINHTKMSHKILDYNLNPHLPVTYIYIYIWNQGV